MTDSSTGKICPTCGARVSEGAARCAVCGSNLAEAAPAKSEKGLQGSRMPEVTLSLPLVLFLMVAFLVFGAAVAFFLLRSTGRVVEPTITPTVTPSLTPTLTPTPVTPTATSTPEPSPTPLTYVVAEGDNCIIIAASFKVSVQSIVLQNNLPANCGTLFIGQRILIPQPTPTPTPQPTATLSGASATEQACERVNYTVQPNDTLSGIAAFYNVPIAAIRSYNGLPSDNVISGTTLVIPLCERFPTPGPTPTFTPPPPYGPPALLLPADGKPFAAGDGSITLQWSSVGALRPNESYVVTVRDVTQADKQPLVAYVTDTKYIVPASFRPADGLPHVLRWTVGTVRQVSSDENGNPVWEPAGAVSEPRNFVWSSAP